MTGELEPQGLAIVVPEACSSLNFRLFGPPCGRFRSEHGRNHNLKWSQLSMRELLVQYWRRRDSEKSVCVYDIGIRKVCSLFVGTGLEL